MLESVSGENTDADNPSEDLGFKIGDKVETIYYNNITDIVITGFGASRGTVICEFTHNGQRSKECFHVSSLSLIKQKTMKFKVGDNVWYVSGKYTSNNCNPLHTDYPDVVRKIVYIDDDWHHVHWSNGTENGYKENDLQLVEEAQEQQFKKGDHVPKNKLRVGMVVICRDKNRAASSCWKEDEEVAPLKITRVEDNGNKIWRESLTGKKLTQPNSDGSCSCGDLDHLYLYEEPATPVTSTNNKSIMSSIVDFFRNLTASSDDKLLKEMALEDPIGVPTATGLQLSNEIQYKKNREEIVKIAQSMKDEQEKAKK